MATAYFGQFGGRVLRPFTGSGGTKFISGAILTPEMVETWPVPNRIALSNLGNIDWFGPPTADESAARDAGKPKSAPKVKVEVTTPAPAKSKRTK